ncbi:MAG: hypothetical protein ACRD3J_11475 [Thermoanaerobaculia bacterium]
MPSHKEMRCSRSTTMNRKTLALAIVLLLAALAPVAAIIGFCARMPCCGQAPAGAPALTNERADCCTTIACYESPSATISTAAAASFSALAMPALAAAAPTLPAPDVRATLPAIDPSPPMATRDRLAQLSILLI